MPPGSAVRFAISDHYRPVPLIKKTDKCFDCNEQQTRMIVRDLKLGASSGLMLQHILLMELMHEPGTDRVRPNLAVRVIRRFPYLCPTLRGQQGISTTLLLGTVSGDGLCSVDASRELARHRSEFECASETSLSLRFSFLGQTLEVGRRQRESRLENLCRFCPQLDQKGPPAVCRYGSRIGSRRHCLCAGCDDHRSVSVVVSMGQLPSCQGRCETAHDDRYSECHSRLHRYHSRQNLGRSGIGSYCSATGLLYRHGSWLHRFPSSVWTPSSDDLFCHPSQSRSSIPEAAFTTNRQNHRCPKRSDYPSNGSQNIHALSGSSAPGQLLLGRNRQAFRLPDQRFPFAAADRSGHLSQPLAGRTVLQMDQTAFAHQALRRNFPKLR